jgi:WD40 repeat protein
LATSSTPFVKLMVVVCNCLSSPLAEMPQPPRRPHAARVWNTSGELVVTLAGHTDAVTGVAWVPQSESVDAQTCVTGSFDETLRLWRVNLGTRTADCAAV